VLLAVCHIIARTEKEGLIEEEGEVYNSVLVCSSIFDLGERISGS